MNSGTRKFLTQLIKMRPSTTNYWVKRNKELKKKMKLAKIVSENKNFPGQSGIHLRRQTRKLNTRKKLSKKVSENKKLS